MEQTKCTIFKSGTSGPAKVDFKRKGSYNQSFFGWMSSDEKQMAGYFLCGGQKFPFACSTVDNNTYSAVKQTNLDGAWTLKCNGTATDEITISGRQELFKQDLQKMIKSLFLNKKKLGNPERKRSSSKELEATRKITTDGYLWIKSKWLNTMYQEGRNTHFMPMKNREQTNSY